MAETSDRVKWYVVHTYSGYENKVKVNLEKSVENNGLQDKIVEVCIPVEEAIEIKNSKRRTVQHKLLPGYVLVRMEMTDETWYIVRNTRGVTGFVGAANKPIPLSDSDYEALVHGSEVKTNLDIQVGDEVRILAGMFESFTGTVESINLTTHRIHVNVRILNRETDVEVDYDEVIRVDQ